MFYRKGDYQVSKARKKVFPKAVTRSDFISRDTSQHHISGTCETCEHKAYEHKSSAFQDCPVKRCAVRDCSCNSFVAMRFFRAADSNKSAQDQRAARYKSEYLRTSQRNFATKRSKTR